jgi:polyisoprenoid-binding protein YceI
MQRFLTVALTALLLLYAPMAMAKTWVIDYANSHLGFTGKQNAATFDGTFKKFTATIDFDPDHPETGKIAATIDMTSATTGNSTRDGTLPGPDWFDTRHFPAAQFASSHIVRTGANSYEAQGTLTIKGVTKNVILPFTLTPEGDHWRAKGKAALIRSEFNVGQGEWATEETVAFAVDVNVDLAAKPAP